jgi:hypothetical protein
MHEAARTNFLSRIRPLSPLTDRCFVDALWVYACRLQKRVIGSEEEAKAYDSCCGGPARLEDDVRY